MQFRVKQVIAGGDAVWVECLISGIGRRVHLHSCHFINLPVCEEQADEWRRMMKIEH